MSRDLIRSILARRLSKAAAVLESFPE